MGGLDHLSWNGPSWSISAEWFAYLCFPLVAALLRRGSLVLAMGAVFLVVAPEMNVAERTYDFAMIRIMPEFIVGGLLYVAGSRWSLPRGAVFPFALGCLVALLTLAHFGAPNLVIAVPGAGVVFAVAEMSKQGIPSLLRTRPLVYLGDISYAIYMTHSLVILAWFKLVGAGLAQSLALVAIVIACSAIAYHTVEVPFRALLRWRARPVAG